MLNGIIILEGITESQFYISEFPESQRLAGDDIDLLIDLISNESGYCVLSYTLG